MLISSECVNDFLITIESNIKLIKYLGFDSYKAIRDYIVDSDYEEFIELRNESKEFLKTNKD